MKDRDVVDMDDLESAMAAPPKKPAADDEPCAARENDAVMLRVTAAVTGIMYVLMFGAVYAGGSAPRDHRVAIALVPGTLMSVLLFTGAAPAALVDRIAHAKPHSFWMQEMFFALAAFAVALPRQMLRFATLLQFARLAVLHAQIVHGWMAASSVAHQAALWFFVGYAYYKDGDVPDELTVATCVLFVGMLAEMVSKKPKATDDDLVRINVTGHCWLLVVHASLLFAFVVFIR
jgi:hypothetical protein